MSNDKTHSLKTSILLAALNEEHLNKVQKCCSSLNVDVSASDSGHEALKMAIESSFDLVIIAADMPGMDGYEVASLLRRRKKTQSIPIIFLLSENDKKQKMFKGYEYGPVDYMFYPVDESILASKIKIFIEMQKHKKVNYLETVGELRVVKAELKARNKALSNLANQDALTHLYNRRQFEVELARILRECKRYNKQFALLFCDIDNFKIVNDTLGHDAGDQLLKQISQVFLNNVRQTDIVARLGGDEFGIILNYIDNYREAGNVAKHLLNALSDPLVVSGINQSPTFSIGVACFPFAGQDVTTIMRSADIAMYRAKSMGKNQSQFYNKSLQKEYGSRLEIESNLKFAIEKNEFYLNFQPIYNLKKLEIFGFEALLRWRSENLGDMNPDQFIAIAEESGDIHAIGQWVLSESFKVLKDWQSKDFKGVKLAVNISGKQIQFGDFYNKLMMQASEHGISLKDLVLEVSESVLMKNKPKLVELLQKITGHGVKFLIDDFGTGYSSLVDLRNLPVCALKIDNAFVGSLGESSDGGALVKAIIAMARNLGIQTIAEGVETKEQCLFLKNEGCRFGQGYHLGKPMSRVEACRLLASGKYKGCA